MLLDVFAGAVGSLVYFFAGWRYVLSPRYRAATAARWRTMRRTEVMQDIVAGVASMIIPILLVAFVWWELRAGV